MPLAATISDISKQNFAIYLTKLTTYTSKKKKICCLVFRLEYAQGMGGLIIFNYFVICKYRP